MNLQVFGIGRLTRDVETRFTKDQKAVASFGLAFNTKRGDVEEVAFVDCTAWEKNAENIAKFFSKGKPIFIQGRIRQENWEDKNGGGKRSKLSVTVDRWEFVGGPKEDGEQKAAPSDREKPTDPIESRQFEEDSVPF